MMAETQPWKLVGRLAGLSCALWLAFGFTIATAQAAGTETFGDNFDSVSYSGSNGTLPWSAAWVETGESDGPGSGRAKVVTEANCSDASCGLLTAGGSTTVAIQRRANLNGASNATLTFSHRRSKVGGNAALVRVAASANGGVSWTTLATYVLDTTDGASVSQSLNIAAFASSQTEIRFRVESVPGQSGRYHFDNVQIVAEFPDPTTTTTTTAAPTTTTTTTTTTTGPPGQSTTTSTTVPGTTTTTTAIPGATTTAAPPGSTTLPPGTTSSTAVPSTTVVPPTTTAAPATVPPSTPPPEPAVALPPTTSHIGALPPPFPIAPATGPGRQVAADTGAVDSDTSSLVRDRLGEYLAASPAASVATGERSTTGVVLDASRDAARLSWPALVVAPVLAVGLIRSRVAAFRSRRRLRRAIP